MKTEWVTDKCGSEEVVVFVLGWSADSSVAKHLIPPGCDALFIHDYRDIGEFLRCELLLGELKKRIGSYQRRWLVAWSFGVWVAEKIFGSGPEFTRAVAFNGTPRPIDDRYGIHPRRMAVTLRGLQVGGMEAFNTKVYGSSYDSLCSVLSARSLEENIEELKVLDDLARERYEPRLGWDKAVVGSEDLIFSPENMCRYWSEVAEIETEILPLPHYPFADRRIVWNDIGK